jgi:inhibitor of cysteine peptidase
MQNKFYKTILFILTLAVSMATITGCKPKNVQLTEADNNKEVTLEVGNQLTITLPGNPSTGYNWEVKTIDAAIVEQAGEPQFVSDNTELVGAGGQLTLTFEALKAGSTNIELVYHRAWETDVAPLQTFTIQVTVK